MSIPLSAMGDSNVAHTLQLATQAPHGPIIEVGVYQGGMAYHLAILARERQVALHLFDTFSGIPYGTPDDSNHVGEFSDTSHATVAALIPDAIFHVGIFPDTLPDDLRDIAFVHSDCDQYQSVRAVIDHLWPRMMPGGMMVFDDMDTNGGRRAILETFDGQLLNQHGRNYIVKPMAS